MALLAAHGVWLPDRTFNAWPATATSQSGQSARMPFARITLPQRSRSLPT
jgi:hypothetical protein